MLIISPNGPDLSTRNFFAVYAKSRLCFLHKRQKTKAASISENSTSSANPAIFDNFEFSVFALTVSGTYLLLLIPSRRIRVIIAAAAAAT